ncbi:hypothetical protein C8R46DRAFT_1219750 [Mycena filopes]|nr:hypothetical protein C8R46DRAFT_1219750 [Mycena filopes]
MSVFDPPTVLEILKTLAGASNAQKKFATDWKNSVAKRLATWLNSRGNDSQLKIQLEWEANIVEYVDFIHKETSLHGNKKNSTGPPTLRLGIPVLGPRFIPPSLHAAKKRDPFTAEPSLLYIRPLNIIHPFYYDISTCPQCDSTETKWDSWTGAGSRDVHGVRCEEKALGFQLRCAPCKAKYGANGTHVGARNADGDKLGSSFATTNPIFWERVEHWKIPRGVPIFLYRSALTRELFDFIVEVRPSTTSGRLADNIKQLHLLEYKQRHLEYLNAFKTRLVPRMGRDNCQLRVFSAPDDAAGYNDKSITDDLISTIFLAFSARTRIKECAQYLRNLSAVCINLDNTFKAASKATVVDETKARSKPMKGGILSVLNELNEIISWRFCQSGAAAEITEMLEGLKARHDFLGVPHPVSATVDNCCTVGNKIRAVFAAIKVLLDVYHFIMRYAAGILNGSHNTHRKEILKDIRSAIIKEPATKDGPAKYWLKAEQEARLQSAFDKWAARGVWSAAIHNIHAAQMQHVRKGCLHRENQDLPSDGSRIEGSHKGWNSLQRSFASGLEMQTALGHDFVLRRNIRVGLNGKARAPKPFIKSTHGSHHIALVDYTAMMWNSMLNTAGGSSTSSLQSLPRLANTESGETFGLVNSPHTESFGGLFTIKQEPEEDEDFVKELHPEEQEDLARELGLDPALFNKPLIPSAAPPPSMVIDVDLVDASTPPQDDAAKSENILMHSHPVTAIGSPVVQRTKRKLATESDSPSPAPIAGDQEAPEAKRARVESTIAIHPIFLGRSGAPVAPMPDTPATATSLKLSKAELTAPLARSRLLPKLTRSQALFQSHTGTDIRSLKIHSGAEFFLFMEMRVDLQLKSFEMTPKKWVGVTETYNSRLKALPVEEGHAFVPKNPRALLDKLGEVETQVITRRTTDNFRSATSGTESFWKKHCFAVPFIKTEPDDSATTDASSASTDRSKGRKPQTCTRCKAIKYPGPTGAPENHRLKYCSDGFKPTLANDTPAIWPQPTGIFTNGTDFHPFIFLSSVRELHEKLVVEGAMDHDLSLELDAFRNLLQARMVIDPTNGVVMWKLFAAFTVPASDGIPDELFVDYDGARHLYINSLSDNDLPISQ